MDNSKITIKIIIGVIIFLSIGSFSYLGYKKVEKNKIEAEASLVEMQRKLDSQKSTMDVQQSKIDELQGFKEEQQIANEQMSEQDRQNKKADCESRFKKAQDALAASQRYVEADQKALKEAKNDSYLKECLGENDGDGMSSKQKDYCKSENKANIKNREGDLQGDEQSVANGEKKLIDIRNECHEYLN